MSQGTIMSEFYCTQCGNRGIPVHRRKGKFREAGHLKKLFCLYCGKEQNHVEIRPMIGEYTYEDFRIEFENGNFTPEGQRKETWRQCEARVREQKGSDE